MKTLRKWVGNFRIALGRLAHWLLYGTVIFLPVIIILHTIQVTSLPTDETLWRESHSLIFVEAPRSSILGLQPGDVFINFDDTIIQSEERLREVLAKTPGTVKVYREGRAELLEGVPPIESWDPKTIRQIGPALLILSVQAGGSAEKAGVCPGDIITHVNGKPIGPASYSDPVFVWMTGQKLASGTIKPNLSNAQLTLERAKIGSHLTFDIFHLGKPGTVQVEVVRRGFAGIMMLINSGTGLYVPLLLVSLLGSFCIWNGYVPQGLGSRFISACVIACMVFIPLNFRLNVWDYTSYQQVVDAILALVIASSIVRLFICPLNVEIDSFKSVLAKMHLSIIWESVLYACVITGLLAFWYQGFPPLVGDSTAGDVAWFIDKLLGRGVVSYLLIFIFVMSLHHLGQVDRSVVAAIAPANTSYSNGLVGGLLSKVSITPDRNATDEYIEQIVDREETRCANAFLMVGWCETALPVLGFIGTVIGLSGALPEMSKILSETTGNSEDQAQAMRYLREAFFELAVAFDTTFIGLVLLLIIALRHTLLKRRCAAHLEHLTEALSGVAERVMTTSTTTQLMNLREVVDRNDRMLETIIEEARSPAWTEIRTILHRWLVEFGSEPIEKDLTSTLPGGGDWYIDGLHAFGYTGDTGLALAKSGNKTIGLIRLEINNNSMNIDSSLFATFDNITEFSQVSHAIPSRDSSIALLVINEQELAIYMKDDPTDRHVRLSHKPDDSVLGAWVLPGTDSDIGIAVVQGKHSTNVRAIPLSNKDATSLKTHESSHFQVGLAAFDARSSTLWLLGEERGRGLVVRRHGLKIEADSTNVVLSDLPQTLLVGVTYAEQLIPLGRNRVVITTKDQRVVLWSHGMANSLDATPPEWPQGNVTVSSNGGLYLSVFDWGRSELSMWRVGKSGRISEVSRSDGQIRRLKIGQGYRKDVLATVSDGKTVLAANKCTVYGWRYPRRADDGLTEGATSES